MLRRNILIFHLGALGDFILSWPFALALSRIYPQSRIIYVTHGEKGQLAEKVLRLESSDIESGWHGLFADAAPLPPRVESFLTGAQAIYSFISPTASWIENVRRLNPAVKIVALEARPANYFDGHASQWLLNQLAEHAIERAATEQILRSIADRGLGFTRPGGGDIVIHPGSGSPDKCWPLENFIELGKKLAESGKRVRFVIGEVERELWPKEHFDRLAAIGELHQPDTYLKLLTELSTAGTFIGNDSGPGHLAGIIGVPTVSIFTSTNPAQWRPLGPRVKTAAGAASDDVFEMVSGAE